MDALPDFRVLNPATLEEAIAARAAHPESKPLGGGTDLVVNIRRGIEAPKVLIDMNRVHELHGIKADAQSLEIGASVRISELATHPGVIAHYPVLAQAAAHIAGPTHRTMGTVGGNLCLDTRCIFYNQSEWWRSANNHCLKTTGTVCHVAPKSRGVCFATYSGDLAPALLTLSAEVDIAGPQGRRTIPLRETLYRLRAPGLSRHRNPRRRQVLSLAAAGRAGHRGARARTRPACARPTTRSAFAVRSNTRWRASRWRSGARATRSRDLSIGFTGTNPRPVLLAGTDELCGGPLDQRVHPRPRRAGARPDHADEDHLHARPLPAARGGRVGAPPARPAVRGVRRCTAGWRWTISPRAGPTTP